eukprot:s955_g19.t1
MAVSVNVGLLSGASVRVHARLKWTVEDLKESAQVKFRIGNALDSRTGIMALIRNSGSRLAGSLRVADCCLEDDEHLTALTRKDKRVQTWDACAGALLRGDGSVVCDGLDEELELEEELHDVQQLVATRFAFAALLGNGTVVTWGKAAFGGRGKQEQLKRVELLRASMGAFAAIRDDGTVVAWGLPSAGGDAGPVQHQLQHVRDIAAASTGFAALLADGAVVTWGLNGRAFPHGLRNVRQLASSRFSFAALLSTGSVVTWGAEALGGDSSSVQAQLQNVKYLRSTVAAFAALLDNGQVVTWGHPDVGGDSSRIAEKLQGVRKVEATREAFAALLCDGSVISWGNPAFGGNTAASVSHLRSVQDLESTEVHFTAHLSGSASLSWGHLLETFPPNSPLETFPDFRVRGPCCLRRYRRMYMYRVQI